jgi:signal peptidase I
VFINGRELLAPETVIAPSYGSLTPREALYPQGVGFTEDDYGPIRVPKAGDSIALDPAMQSWWMPILQRAGHTVEIRSNGSVLVDGDLWTAAVMDVDQYFVLGDHRDNSADSRMWGFVRQDEIVGEALLVYWSSQERDEHDAGGSVRWDRIGTLIR